LALLLGVSIITLNYQSNSVEAQSSAPEMTVPNLVVRTTVANLITPISMAFIGANDFLVLEKNTGQVKRVVNNAVQGTVLDLGVNFASERGLLGIALHPNFPSNPGVSLLVF
jgi:glucose/arabinose dehydrogenase